MPGNPQTSKGTYKVAVEDEAWEGLSSLPESAQEKVTAFWRDHLQHRPTQRIPGKLKELKGEYKGYYQFDISMNERMIYTVNEDLKTVYVEYIGKHPDWGRRRGRAF